MDMDMTSLEQLLAQMRAESERNAAAIEALERTHAENSSALHDRLASNQSVEEEVAEITAKAYASAGNARANIEVLAAEQRERAMLDAEAERLASELADSTSTLESMQVRSADAAQELASDLAPLRCAFRKRCRAGFSNAVRLACALTVLEGEVHTRGEGMDAIAAETALGKRACIWPPQAQVPVPAAAQAVYLY